MSKIFAVFLAFLTVSFLRADAPPDVEAALRSRVQEFYQLQKDHKFREAEDFVAANTKDYYFGARKPNITAFRIVGIDYAPDFQKATVRLMASSPIPLPGAESNPIEAPVISHWKLEDGKWCWYVDQSKLLDTPFGRVNPSGASGDSATVAQIQQATPQVAASISTAVQADPIRISLNPAHPAAQVVKLKNSLPGPVTIQIVTSSMAFNVSVANPKLGANESTELRITPVAGSSDRPAQLVVRIGPVGQVLRIPITWISAR